MKRYLLVLLLALILLIPFLTFFMIVGVREIDTTVAVGGELGFNVDTDKLYFGTLLPGGHAERSLDIDSLACKKCLVVINKNGELADWLDLSADKFVIKQWERKSVNVVLSVPEDASEGTYNGTLKIIFWKTI